MRDSQRGFTLLEVLIAVAMIGLLSLIAYPSLRQWRDNASYRQAASQAAGMLRDARGRSIAQNLDHWVDFDVANRTCRFWRREDPLVADDADVQLAVFTFPDSVGMRTGPNCDLATNTRFTFLPNGSGRVTVDGGVAFDTVCVMERGGARRFRVSMNGFRLVTNLSPTARIVIGR